MGNQAISEAGTPSVIASSAIIKKSDQLRMKLGLMIFLQKSMKPLQVIAFTCKQRENYSN